MTYSAIRVANRFLEVAANNGDALTPIQIIKLTYIAHGWSLAMLDRPLIGDRIEAWKYGPVIPAIYKHAKHFGSSPVSAKLPINKLADRARGYDAQISKTDDQLIKSVFKNYGQLDGIKLSNLTHMEGTPWAQVYDSEKHNVEISNESIKSHYKEKLADAG